MNLIKTEIKKTNFKAYFKAALGVFAGILATGILFLFIPYIEYAAPKGEELFRE